MPDEIPAALSEPAAVSPSGLTVGMSPQQRLDRAMRQADEHNLADSIPKPERWSTSAPGVPNPYGRGLAAFEPNNVIFDSYAQAKGEVDDAKAKEAELASVSSKLPMGGAVNLAGVPYAELFTAAGEKYGVSPALLAAVARAESGFRPDAKSPVGALGLMQFMPATAKGLGVNPLDPASAVDGAARYLKQQLDKFGSVDLALAAYNAGPGAVTKYGGIPPYAETQNYVKRITGYMTGYAGTPGAPGPTGSTLGDASGKVGTAVRSALALAAKRVPYVWGGTGPNGVDCSGLIHYAFQAAGINLPRYRAVDYGHMGQAVTLDQARPGDIIYFDTPGTTTDHVGIYIGNGQMVQAPQSGDVVKVSSIGHPTSIRRIFDDSAFSSIATPTGTGVAYGGRPWNPAVGTFQPGLSNGASTANALGSIGSTIYRKPTAAPAVHGTPF